MRKIIFILFLVVAVASCSSVDCPLNNTVYMKFRLDGEVTTLTDTLTVSVTRSEGTDTVLLNRAINTDSFSIPLSYQHEQDIFYFDIRPKDGARTLDTVCISKTNEPHFESVDCPASMFHTINAVAHTRHRIDSIAINKNKVTYDDSHAHLLIYFKNSNR